MVYINVNVNVNVICSKTINKQNRSLELVQTIILDESTQHIICPD